MNIKNAMKIMNEIIYFSSLIKEPKKNINKQFFKIIYKFSHF